MAAQPVGESSVPSEPPASIPSLDTDATSDSAKPLAEGPLASAEKSVVLIRAMNSKGSALGSGFLVSEKGIIATNYHVIEGATAVTVAFPSGALEISRGYFAIEPGKDLALLECNLTTSSPKPLELAIDLPKQLDSVIAVGSPGGLAGTMSTGVISAIRTVAAMRDTRSSAPDLDAGATLIQTTAAISAGSSGGPLLNERGQVLGVTTMSRAGGQNLNFAIASQHIASLLNKTSQNPRPWSDLPAPRTEPTIAKEKSQPAAELVAKAILESQEKQTKTAATQSELNRILQRSGDITRALSTIEMEGTALTQRRGQVMSRAAAGFSRGESGEQELSQLEAALSNCNAQHAQATASGDRDRAAYLQLQFAQIDRQIAAISKELTSLNATLAGLDREARDLLGQIQYKTAQKSELNAELSALRQRYDELSRQ